MMTQFLKWVENKDETLDSIIKAAIAHLWFVAIHPFDDGNGRITRTITDMLLARSDNMPHRYYSMSATICANRKSYYSALENTTVGDLDVTNWILWFIETLKQALENAIATIERTIRKSQFWQRHRAVATENSQQASGRKSPKHRKVPLSEIFKHWWIAAFSKCRTVVAEAPATP